MECATRNMKNLQMILLLFNLIYQFASVNGYCTTDKDCEHDGICNNHKCECEVSRYAGSNCQYFVEDYLKTNYLVYFYTITALSIILWIVTSLKTYQVHRDGKKFTVIHLACWFLSIGMLRKFSKKVSDSLVRTISYLLVVDQKWDRDDHLEPFSGLCFYLFYPLLFSAFLCMIFLWYLWVEGC